MEDVTRTVMLERLHKRQVACTVAAFFALLFLCLLIGALGPAALVQSHGSGRTLRCQGEGCDATWRGNLTSMSPLNQFLYLRAAVQKPELKSGDSYDNVALTYVQSMIVSVWARREGETDYTTLVDRATHDRQVTCAAESDTCGSFVVFTEPFIEYRNYSLEVTLLHPTQAFAAAGVQHGVDVDFELTYVYTSYTQFEIGFKAAFFLASLLIATAFIVAMRRLHPRRATWSYEQKWVACLLILLCCYNNPLFALGVYFPGVVLSTVMAALQSAFLSALFLFWLCFLDVLRISSDGSAAARKSRGWLFYVPKVFLIGTFWVVGMLTFYWTRAHEAVDPTYSVNEDEEDSFYVFVVMAGIVVVYLLWVFVLICMATRALKVLARPFRFVLLMSLLTLVLSAGGLFGGVYFGAKLSSVTFIFFYGLFNVYVWTLAFAYVPVPNGGEEEGEAEAELTGIMGDGAAGEGADGAGDASDSSEEEIDLGGNAA